MTPDYIIFTDASVILPKDCLHSSAYASVILNYNTLNYTVISGPLANRSIVFCECWAIYQGLRYLKKLRKDIGKDKLKILIVSDSKLIINTFTQWIKYNWDLSDWSNWKKSDNTPVLNQELYRKMYHILSNEHLKVRFTHINSHSKGNSSKQKAIFAKLERDKIHLSDAAKKIFIDMNDVADKTAHKIAVSQIKHPTTLEILRPKLKRKD